MGTYYDPKERGKFRILGEAPERAKKFLNFALPVNSMTGGR
jgi:hypothetical protein